MSKTRRIICKCISCNRELEYIAILHSVSDGIVFHTRGNYGSTVLDMNALVEGYICDDCLRNKGRQLVVLKETYPGRSNRTSKSISFKSWLEKGKKGEC